VENPNLFSITLQLNMLAIRRFTHLFTGIIEEIGVITSIQRKPRALAITIRAKIVLEDVNRGDSISVNGVCLTVSSYTNELFVVDVIPETFNSTTLSMLKINSQVNLERAMVANGRFGGHFVSGHVDGIGVIRSIKKDTNAITKKIELDPSLMKYMMVKGSVSIDGTSLTIFQVDQTSITISLIPTTQNDSLVGQKGIGERVNVECDMLAKYTERIQTTSSKLSKEWLQEHGF
jgi:riboflavin synthase